MASPDVLVNGLDPTSGVFVNGGDTVTIQLLSLAGVNGWVCRAFSVSSPYVPLDINNLLSINNTTKTVTFTAPVDAGGYSILFESIINGQIDTINGQFRPEWRKTFGVAVKIANGRTAFVFGESTEFSQDYGWEPRLNELARNATVPSGLAGAGLYDSAGVINVGALNGSILVGADAITVGTLQSDSMHGNLGGGLLHSTATSGAHGFMSASDKIILDGATSANTANQIVKRSGTGQIDAGKIQAFNSTNYISLDPGGTKIETNNNLFYRTINETGLNVSSKILGFFTGDSVSGDTGNMTHTTGAASGITRSSGAMTHLTGNAGNSTGTFSQGTGNASNGNSGIFQRFTGGAGGNTGRIDDITGSPSGAGDSGNLTRQSGSTLGAGKTGDINDFIGVAPSGKMGNIQQIGLPPVAATVAAQAAIYTARGKVAPTLPTNFQGCYGYVVPTSGVVIAGITYKADDYLILNRHGVTKISASSMLP